MTRPVDRIDDAGDDGVGASSPPARTAEEEPRQPSVRITCLWPAAAATAVAGAEAAVMMDIKGGAPGGGGGGGVVAARNLGGL